MHQPPDLVALLMVAAMLQADMDPLDAYLRTLAEVDADGLDVSAGGRERIREAVHRHH